MGDEVLIMVRTFEQIKTDVQNRQIRSFDQIQKDVATRGIFAGGLPDVLRDERLQEFLSTDTSEEEKYKLANSLYLSSTYKQPFDKVYQNYEGVVAQLFPHTKPKAVFEKIQWASQSEKQKFAAYDKDKSFWQKADDRLNRVGANTMKQIAGLDEAFSDISLKIQEKLFGRDIFGVTEKLKWSKNMRLAIQQDMEENPGIYMNPAGTGFWDTTKNYIANPEFILLGALEQTPLIIASILTSGTAGAVAKGVGLGIKATKAATFLGGAQGFAIPLFGDRYSDLRTQNVPPEQAFAEAFLASQAEGLLEEWTKIFNIRLFKGPGVVAKRGISDNVAKWLLDKPWYVKAGAFTGSVYAQGASEEFLQQISDNFFAMMFRNVNTSIFEGVGEAAATGGILELAMGTGFKLSGKIYNPGFVSEEEQLARLDVIREVIAESPIEEKGRQEIDAQLDTVEKEITEGKFTAPAQAPVEEPTTGIDEKLGIPASNKIADEPDPIKRTERFGIQEVEGKWIVTDWETQKEVSVHGNSQLALKKMIGLNKGEIEAKKERRAPLPPSEKVTLTIRQIFNLVMKAESKVARTAYIQAAKKAYAKTKVLGRVANDLLKDLDITRTERKRLITHVTTAKTPNQRAVVMAVIQKIRDDSLKRVAVDNLKKTIAFINSKVGKNMYEKGIRPEYYEKIQAIIEGITTKKITDKTRKRIASLMDYLARVKSEATSQYETAYIEEQIPKSLLAKIPLLGLKNINDMSLTELKEMDDTLRLLIHLNNAKSGIIMGARAEDVTQMIDSSMDEVEGLRQRPMDTSDEFSTDPHPENWYSKILSFFAGNRNHDIESLAEAISSGTHGTIHTTLAKGLSRGRRSEAGFLNEWDAIQKKHFEKFGMTVADLQEFSDSFFQVLSPELRKKLGVKRAKRYSVTIGGKKAPMTMAELMSLYMHAQAVDFNLPAMLKQGVANVHHVPIGKITYAEIEKIADIVEGNKKAIGLVRMAQEVLLFSTDKINEVSLLLDGVLTAKEKNYWHVERQTTGGIAGRQLFRISLLESQGRLQEREGSDRPVVIRDFFEALTSDEQAIGEYVGLAIPLRSIKNILNYRPLRDKLINKKGYGQELKFIDVLLQRLEQKPKAYSQTDTVVKMINRGLVRAVLANPGVMAGQYASTLGYFSEADWKYKSALRVKADKATQERYKEHSALYKRRVEGGISSVAIHHAMQSDLLLRTFADKKQYINYLTSGIHSVDTMAMTEGGRIAEAEMKDKNLSSTSLEYWKAQGIDPTKLEFESTEYWEAWEDRFDFLTRRTQPMFFTENRSVLTSAETDLEKSLYLFRSYVDQPLRILFRAINDYRNERISKRSLLGQVATIQASLTFYAIMRFAIDQILFRDDDDEVDLIEEILIAPVKILNLIGYPLSLFIENVISHKVKGEPLNFRSTGLAPMPIQFAEAVLNAIFLLGKGLAVDSKEKFQSGPRKGRNKGEAFIAEAILEIIGLALKAYGIPVDTVEDLIKGKAEEQESKKRIIKFQG